MVTTADKGSVSVLPNRKTNTPSISTQNEQNKSKSSEQKKPAQVAVAPMTLAAAREALDKLKLMGHWEKLTSKSIDFALRLIDNRFRSKMPSDLCRSLMALSTCIINMQDKEGPDPKSMIEEISKAITVHIESKLNLGIERVEVVAEKSRSWWTTQAKIWTK